MLKSEVCLHCTYYKPSKPDHGLCHRNPPTLFWDYALQYTASEFLEVKYDDFCGEFKARSARELNELKENNNE